MANEQNAPTQEIPSPQVGVTPGENTGIVTTAGNTANQLERKNLPAIIRDWPMSRKIGLAFILAVSVALFTLLIIEARTIDQQLLYANLPAADAAEITTWLKGQNIPYSLKNRGRDIWIPADKIYQSRLDLAASGMPSGGGVGFEIFDKQSFALTDYVQKVNMTRALQGELARTITSLEPVESTRVHLALPEKRLFNKEQKNVTASVIVTLAAGQSLDNKQVQGIVHLVAGSVPDLQAKNVRVIDQNGLELEPEKEKEAGKIHSEDMLSFQQEVESRLEKRVQDLLDRTMGRDNAMVRITATLDFAHIEKTQEFFDGDDPVIRSQQTKQEYANGLDEGGIPGVESNMQGNTLLDGEGKTHLSKNSNITNYEISKTISKTVNPIGTISKLSVSVMVADKITPPEEEGEKPTTTSRSPAELMVIENMVGRAIGLDIERGDQISVQSMPFVDTTRSLAENATTGSEGYYQYLPIIKYALIALGALLVYFLLLRPIIKTMKNDFEEQNKAIEALEREKLEAETSKKQEDQQNELEREQQRLNLPPPVEEGIMQLRKEIMTNQIPTAFILKNWLHET